MKLAMRALALFGMLFVTTQALAVDFASGTLGSTSNVYVQTWCPNNTAYMYGTWGYAFQNKLWLVAGLCSFGGSTASFGTGNGYAGVPGPGTQQNSNCNSGDRVIGLAGTYDSSGINTLKSRCWSNRNSKDYYGSGSLGGTDTANYSFVRCGSGQHAVGVYGHERPRVLRVGVICRQP